jgi:uncharacterized membrane protein
MNWASLIKQFTEGFSSFWENAEHTLNRRMKEFEGRILGIMHRIRKAMYRIVLEMYFLALGITLFFIGAAFFLSRFFSLDVVLFGLGLVALYIWVMFRVIK